MPCVTTTLTDAASGGTWTTSDATKATVVGGVVTGVASGSATISYTVINSCGPVSATRTLTISPAPAAGTISGAGSVCVGTSAILTPSMGGGVWSAISPNATISAGVVTGVTAGMDTIKYAVTNSCGTAIASFPVQVNSLGVWLGASSTNGNDAANWPCGVIPDSTTKITIPAGTPYSPNVPASVSVSYDSISVASSAVITLGSGSALHVKGNFTNSGVIAGAGSVILEGSAPQYILGQGNVSNLILNNTAGATIVSGSRLIITNALTITAGAFKTSDSLVLNSDSTGTARITALPTGTSVVGKVQARQYIAGGHRAFRFWGHPFVNAVSLSQIEGSIDITGPGGSSHGFTSTITNAPSCFRYDPRVANSALGYDPGWKPFTDTSSAGDTNMINRFQGVRLFVRGHKGQGLDGLPYTVAPVTVSMAGPVNQGNLTVHMVKGTGANQDYNQLANPYPSPVDIGTVAANAKAHGNIAGAAIYVWDPYLGVNGQFLAIPIDSTAYYIQANTSFQIRAAHNGDSLNFAESNKAVSGANTLLRESRSGISLKVYDEDQNLWDMVSLKFNEAATTAEDNDYDAVKPNGPAGLNFYALSSDSKKMAIDTRPYVAGMTIPLGITSDFAQNFVIKADAVTLPDNGKIYLHDKMLGKYIPFTQGAEYTFAVSANKISVGDNRFELTTVDPSITSAEGLHVTMQPNPATDNVHISFTSGKSDNVTVRVMDMSGVCISNMDLGKQQNGEVILPVSKLAVGIYMVELTSGNQKTVQKLVKE